MAAAPINPVNQNTAEATSLLRMIQFVPVNHPSLARTRRSNALRETSASCADSWSEKLRALFGVSWICPRQIGVKQQRGFVAQISSMNFSLGSARLAMFRQDSSSCKSPFKRGLLGLPLGNKSGNTDDWGGEIGSAEMGL
jgi:hypothetical protein